MSDQALSHCTFSRTSPLYIPMTNTTSSTKMATNARIIEVLRNANKCQRYLCLRHSIRCAGMRVKRTVSAPVLRRPVTAFYNGESQEKNFPGDWKEQRFLLVSPAQVMLAGSWGSLFSPLHLAVVTTPSGSGAASSAVAKCQP